MANKNLWLKEFDPDAAYMARRALKMGKRILHPGQSVPRDKFSTRRLRQLYESRKIIMVEAETSNSGNGDTGFAIEPKGPGWATILKDGQPFEGPLRPNKAKKRLAELNAGV